MRLHQAKADNRRVGVACVRATSVQSYEVGQCDGYSAVKIHSSPCVYTVYINETSVSIIRLVKHRHRHQHEIPVCHPRPRGPRQRPHDNDHPLRRRRQPRRRCLRAHAQCRRAIQRSCSDRQLPNGLRYLPSRACKRDSTHIMLMERKATTAKPPSPAPAPSNPPPNSPLDSAKTQTTPRLARSPPPTSGPAPST